MGKARYTPPGIDVPLTATLRLGIEHVIRRARRRGGVFWRFVSILGTCALGKIEVAAVAVDAVDGVCVVISEGVSATASSSATSLPLSSSFWGVGGF